MSEENEEETFGELIEKAKKGDKEAQKVLAENILPKSVMYMAKILDSLIIPTLPKIPVLDLPPVSNLSENSSNMILMKELRRVENKVDWIIKAINGIYEFFKSIPYEKTEPDEDKKDFYR